MLNALDDRSPDSAERIRALMFTFEDLGNLLPAAAAVIVRQADKRQMALALKAAPETMKQLFFASMTERSAKLMREDMAGMGPVRARDCEEAQNVLVRLAADATELALAAADHLAARALGIAPGAGIDQAIGRVLKQIGRGQDLQVRDHPDFVEEIERLIAARQDGERRQLNLHVAADDGLAEGDACIEWDQGGLTLDAAARYAAVRANWSRFSPAEPHEAVTQLLATSRRSRHASATLL